MLDPDSPAARWHEFKDRTAASRALAERVTGDLERALRTGAGAALVVSGGTSPVEFFRFLRAAELDWNRVTIVPSDERCVPADHPDSNERMIRAELLQGPAGGARLLSLNSAAPDALGARLASLLPFAGAVLGMGEDGHTASLFPSAPRIGEALASTELWLTQQVPGLPAARISLTPRALLESARIYLLLFSEAKKSVYQAAQKDGPPEALPVRAVIHQNKVPVEAFWAA